MSGGRCRLLTLGIVLLANMLAGCASTVQVAPIATGSVSAGTSRIIISRDRRAQGSLTRFIIADSGAKIGEIGPGSRLVWDRSAGPMLLTASLPDSKGQPPPLKAEVGQGMIYHFTVYAHWSSGTPILELLSSTPAP